MGRATGKQKHAAVCPRRGAWRAATPPCGGHPAPAPPSHAAPHICAGPRLCPPQASSRLAPPMPATPLTRPSFRWGGRVGPGWLATRVAGSSPCFLLRGSADAPPLLPPLPAHPFPRAPTVLPPTHLLTLQLLAHAAASADTGGSGGAGGGPLRVAAAAKLTLSEEDVAKVRHAGAAVAGRAARCGAQHGAQEPAACLAQPPRPPLLTWLPTQRMNGLGEHHGFCLTLTLISTHQSQPLQATKDAVTHLAFHPTTDTLVVACAGGCEPVGVLACRPACPRACRQARSRRACLRDALHAAVHH